MADEQTTTTNDNPVQETVLGSQGSDNQSTDWRSSLSEELKADATLSNIKDVESAAKTLIHQQKMLGSRIPIPKTDEEKVELYTKLGRPEKASEYKEHYDCIIDNTNIDIEEQNKLVLEQIQNWGILPKYIEAI